ncbi:MAG TPA: tetratricopeptide repeat protein [Bacteroidia bacterium]|nr:tetratricopeptide repeat protein [Bacteroidia bacterium]
MKIKLLFLFHIISLAGFSQKAYLDSLWKVWSDVSQPDTVRLKAMDDFAWDGYLYSKQDSAFYFAQLMYDFAESKGLKKFQARALNTQGASFNIKSNYSKALEYFTKGLVLREGMNDKRGVASSLNNIGLIYYSQGNYKSAVEFYTRSLKIAEEIGDKKGEGIALNNIGTIYRDQEDFEKAREYYDRALVIVKQTGDKHGAAVAFNNFGIIYRSEGDLAKAIECYMQSLKIREEIGDGQGEGLALNNIGIVYKQLGEYSKALEYFNRSLKTRTEINDKQGVSASLNSIGQIYYKLKQFSAAIENGKKALEIATEIGAVSQISEASLSLYNTYKKINNYKDALLMHELSVKMNDSIKSEQSKKDVVRQEFKYQYEKKTAADSVKAIEEKKVVAAQFKQEQTQRYALYGGVALLLIFGGFMFNRFRATQKQKSIIELQKQLVEGKQKEVLDSIYYAKRIQQSLLPTEKYINKSFVRLKKN